MLKYICVFITKRSSEPQISITIIFFIYIVVFSDFYTWIWGRKTHGSFALFEKLIAIFFLPPLPFRWNAIDMTSNFLFIAPKFCFELVFFVCRVCFEVKQRHERSICHEEKWWRLTFAPIFILLFLAAFSRSQRSPGATELGHECVFPTLTHSGCCCLSYFFF